MDRLSEYFGLNTLFIFVKFRYYFTELLFLFCSCLCFHLRKLTNPKSQSLHIRVSLNLFLILYFGNILCLYGQENDQIAAATKWHEYAQNLQNAAKDDSAIIAFTKAADLFEKQGVIEKQINCLSHIGRSYQYKGKYEASLPYLQDALKLSQKHLPFIHPERALCHNFLGLAYWRMYRYNDALTNYMTALKIRRVHFGNDHRMVMNILNNMGHLYLDWNDYDKSLSYYLQSINDDIRKNSLKLGERYLNIGAVCLYKGDYQQANNYFQKVLQLLSEENPGHRDQIQMAYFNIGLTFAKQSDEQTALVYYQNALNTFQKDSENMVIILNNMISIYNKSGEFEKALKSCEAGIKLQVEVNPNNYLSLQKLYNNKGYIFVLKAEWDSALVAYQKAQFYIEKIGESGRKELKYVYNGLIDVYSALGQYDKAIEYSTKSLEIVEKIFGPKSDQLTVPYIKYGKIYARQKHYQKALIFYQKAVCAVSRDCNEENVYDLPNAENSLVDYHLLKSLSAKMNAFWELAKSADEISKKSQNLEAILSHYELAKKLVHKIRTGFKSEGSKFLLAKEVYQILDIALASVQALHRISGDQRYLASAFEMGELGKSMALADALAETHARTFSALPKNLLEKEKSLKIDLAAYENRIEKLQVKNDIAEQSLLDSLRGRYAGLRIEYNELLTSFENDYPAYYDLKYSPRQVILDDVRKALGKNGAMIEYFVGEEEICLFLITEKAFLIKSFPHDNAFQQLLSGFNKSIRKDTEAGHFATRSAALYDKLVRPIATEIAGKKRLIIIPDGELHYLPFEALLKRAPENKMDFSQMAYLLNDFEISYHYSANLYLHSLGKAMPKFVNNAGIFAPVFKPGDNTGRIDQSGGSMLVQAKEQAEALLGKVFRSGGTHFKELPYSEAEAEGILEALDWEAQKNYSYISKEATEARFKKDVHKYKYLHLATHSFVNEARPKLSGIAFAQPQDLSAAEDGILYAGEIYNLDVNADLVTLSSCESGVGKLVRGEGLMAMTRGFLYAGAANVVVSLWKVPDKHTSELMIEFYNQIADEKPYPTALRAAKLKLVQHPRTAFPASWSSFILIGR